MGQVICLPKDDSDCLAVHRGQACQNIVSVRRCSQRPSKRPRQRSEDHRNNAFNENKHSLDDVFRLVQRLEKQVHEMEGRVVKDQQTKSLAVGPTSSLRSSLMPGMSASASMRRSETPDRARLLSMYSNHSSVFSSGNPNQGTRDSSTSDSLDATPNPKTSRLSVKRQREICDLENSIDLMVERIRVSHVGADMFSDLLKAEEINDDDDHDDETLGSGSKKSSNRSSLSRRASSQSTDSIHSSVHSIHHPTLSCIKESVVATSSNLLDHDSSTSDSSDSIIMRFMNPQTTNYGHSLHLRSTSPSITSEECTQNSTPSHGHSRSSQNSGSELFFSEETTTPPPQT